MSVAGGSRRTVGFGVVWPGYVYETGSYDETREKNETCETCVAIESSRLPVLLRLPRSRLGIVGGDANGKRSAAGLRGEQRQVLLHEGAGPRPVNAFVEILFDNRDRWGQASGVSGDF